MESLSAVVYKTEDFNPLDYVAKCVPAFEDSEQSVAFCDISDVIWKMNNWRKNFPRIQPFYAIKSNNDEVLVKVLVKMGASFDCASKNEIAQVLQCSVPPEQIVYANPVKSVTDLKFSKKMAVDLMTFDRLSELQKVKNVYPNARLLIRIRFDSSDSVWCFGNKFGCDPATEARGLIQSAINLDLKIVGVAFHIGSGTQDPAVYRGAIKTARGLFDFAEGLGFHWSILNLGGGFPAKRGAYLNKFAAVINQALEDFFPEPEIKVMAEPGQYFSASAYTLFTTINGARNVPSNGSSGMRRQYLVNDSIYNSMMEFPALLFVAEVKGINRRQTIKSEDPTEYDSVIYGQSCCGNDVIVKNVKLKALEMGDLIYFTNMGAYTFCTNTKFNGFMGPSFRYFVHDRDRQFLAQ